jgi:ATP-dependent DNA ligase
VAKWLNRPEFVVVGWSDPEGTRPHLAALLLGYYADDGKLIYAGRVGRYACQGSRRSAAALGAASPQDLASERPAATQASLGSPLILSRVHWVEPRLVAEITYLTWTADNLLRHTVNVGLREDKPATDVRREAPGGR